jgi:plasmid stabilization system protein ParE
VKRLILHPEADGEYAEAAAYFTAIQSGLGTDFRSKVVATLRRVRANPQAGAPVAGTTCRKLLVDRFRYKAIYVELDDRVVVVAIAHPSRDPGYWHARLTDV